MFEEEKQQIIDTGIKIDRYGLIALSGGNVSWRMPSGEILVTPSGMVYEELTADDILMMDIDGKILEGTRRPSVDTIALLYIYNNMPHINSIIHTHQPYATAVGLVADELPCVLTTLANAVKGSVKVCKFSSAASKQMGVETVKNIGEKLAVILKNHGVISVGTDLKQALCSCVYLEEAAKTYLSARAVSSDIAFLTKEQISQAIKIFDHYGQNK
ncbi:class II aldolase/adducin family protein [Pectinatus haikarae]|uniref:L-ribulose-5-phosphate 4-epimerase n=1 Tax=Pectinatus haikarae TaxID=349096 RepID=A0ABT9YBQ6_9FIRM|nr:class II aldolase/adducin family protein [Pectinatus haikarae]MDQ0205063.1 L-ribulose-5-phosphate 4-epimerase [Pectinatus haikarae]